ncbi:hypothetical protein [Paenibacillus sp. RC84]
MKLIKKTINDIEKHIQHPNPAGMTAALMSIVHEGAAAKQALAILK